MTDDTLEQRNRSLNLLCSKESKDTDLSQTTVIELLDQTSFLLLGASILAEAEGIEKVEWYWVIVVVCGAIMTMPGLPRKPASEAIGVDKDKNIEGLF